MECSGSFGARYEIYLPVSIDPMHIEGLVRVICHTAGIERDKVRCGHHDDPGIIDEEDPQAEWIFGVVTQFVVETDQLEFNVAERICRAVYRFFGNRRTVRLMNPAETQFCILYGQHTSRSP